MAKNHRKIYPDHPSIPFSFDDEPEESFSPAASSDITIASAKPGKPLDFISFGSGSSGNSCYVASERGGIIIDAGVKPDFIEKTLASYGIKMSSVHALLLTHDHSDHVRYAYTLLRSNRHIRLFCTNRVLNGLLRRHCISKRIKEYHTPIFKEIPFKTLDFEVTAFDVPHDGSDNMGFFITHCDRNFALATDLGRISDRAEHYLTQADYMVLEANYDLEMLRNGRYPQYLKARIQTDSGHLDNRDTGAFLAKIGKGRLRHAFLCHLSQDNNTPDKAYNTVLEHLHQAGITVGRGEDTPEDRAADMQLTVLPRYQSTRLYRFR